MALTENTEESFIITVYNIFTKTYSLIIDLATVKQMYKYFIDNHIPIRTDILNNIAKEFHDENIPNVEFNKFKYFLCKIISIDFIDNKDDLLFESNTLKIYSTKYLANDSLNIYSTDCRSDDVTDEASTDKTKYNKLIEVKNHLKSLSRQNTKIIFHIIIQIKILANGTYNIFDSTESLTVSEDNFVLSSYNEITQRCIEGCSYAIQLFYTDKNSKLNAIIFPYLIDNFKLNKEVSFSEDYNLKEYITINSIRTSKYNIVTKHFLKGNFLKLDETIFCRDGNKNLFISRFNILELSPYTQMKGFSKQQRLEFFIQNFILKCFVKLISQNHQILEEKIIYWIVLCKEIELKFSFEFLLKNRKYKINAFCINDNCEYILSLNDQLAVNKKKL